MYFHVSDAHLHVKSSPTRLRFMICRLALSDCLDLWPHSRSLSLPLFPLDGEWYQRGAPAFHVRINPVSDPTGRTIHVAPVREASVQYAGGLSATYYTLSADEKVTCSQRFQRHLQFLGRCVAALLRSSCDAGLIWRFSCVYYLSCNSCRKWKGHFGQIPALMDGHVMRPLTSV